MELRFIEQDGKKILQYRHSEWEGGIFWQDVPFEHSGRPREAVPCVKEEPKQKSLAEKMFDAWSDQRDKNNMVSSSGWFFLPQLDKDYFQAEAQAAVEVFVKVIEEEFVRDGSTLGTNTKNALIDHVKKL